MIFVVEQENIFEAVGWTKWTWNCCVIGLGEKQLLKNSKVQKSEISVDLRDSYLIKSY